MPNICEKVRRFVYESAHFSYMYVSNHIAR